MRTVRIGGRTLHLSETAPVEVKAERPACLHLGRLLGHEPANCCGGVQAIHACGYHGHCTPAACRDCREYDQPKPLLARYDLPADPVEVTIGIPVRGQIDLLSAVLDLHRLQRGIVPRFLLVDTGTLQPELDRLRELAQEPDVTLITLPSDPQPVHLSQPVCDAMQVIWDACSTALLLQTHSDCLPASPFSVWDLVRQLDQRTVAVGYQMSPRREHGHWNYRQMVSHTFTLFDRDRIGDLNHSMLAACSAIGPSAVREYYDSRRVNWPDTECGFNHALNQLGYTVGNGIRLLGPERNHTLDKVPHYWHVRSLPSSALYARHYHQRAQGWAAEAIQQAQEWLSSW
jgi:hypothetical protein